MYVLKSSDPSEFHSSGFALQQYFPGLSVSNPPPLHSRTNKRCFQTRTPSHLNGRFLFTGHVQWYRVAKTHRIPYLCRSFSAKVIYLVALL